MASTRNRNTPGDYHQEQTENIENVRFLTQPFYGQAETTYAPGSGLLQGGIYYNQLSYNGCDIESYLRGINATNLVASSFAPQAQLKTLKTLDITSPRPVTLIPEPLVVKTNQRPYPLK